MEAATRDTLLIISLILFTGAVQAPSISVSPSNIDMGEVEAGQTYEYNIYVNPRNTGGPVEVTSSVEGPFFGTLFNSSEVQEEFVSQEGIGSWIDIQEDSVVADPSEVQEFETEDGGTVRAAARIPIEIRVPRDAEPGYHAARIEFGASGAEGNEGFATSNWVLPVIPVEMRVPGNAERSLDVEDVRILRIGENEAQVLALIRNDGTVTTEFRGATVDILNGDDQKVGEVTLSSATIPPGEVQEVSGTWSSDNVEAGDFQVDGTGDYITGRFYIGASDAITQQIQERVEVEDPSGESTSEGSDMPTWLVAMIIMLLAVIMYSFEIDPLWIVLIIGLISISAFVIMTGLPLYVIAITLILGVLMIYYGLI